MRTRKAILTEMPDDEKAGDNLVKASVDIGQLHLEVLLDIRDLLAPKEEKKPEKKRKLFK